MWNEASQTEEQIKLFIERKKVLGIEPIYFHATYLINLADGDRIGTQSKKSLIAEMKLVHPKKK